MERFCVVVIAEAEDRKHRHIAGIWSWIRPLAVVLHTTNNIDMRLSGLQKSVISLYRNCLKETQKKPAVSICPNHHEEPSFSLTDSCRKLKKILDSLYGTCNNMTYRGSILSNHLMLLKERI